MSRRSVERCLAHVLLLALLVPRPAVAQQPGASRSLRLAVENDLIAVRGAGPPPDYDYTHGTRVSVAWAGAPAWMRRLAGGRPSCRDSISRPGGCVATALELGQEIYTPRRDASLPVEGERPYAGWLYAAAAAHVVSPGRARTLGITVGITGPPSLAAEVQNALHRALRNDPQLGWSHQLRFEPGVALRYDERRTRTRSLGGAHAGSFGVSWGAAAGNVRTALHAGADARVGLSGRRLRWAPGEPEVEQPMRVYARGGWRQEIVLRDLFVDGNTFGPTTRAERRLAVDQYEIGLGVRHRHYALEYRHVSRGREYDAQPGRHAYGVVIFQLHEP